VVAHDRPVAARLAEKKCTPMAIRALRSFCRGDTAIGKNLDLSAQDFFSALSIVGSRKRR